MMNVLHPLSKNKQLSFKNSAQITSDVMKLGQYYNTTYSGKNKNALIKVANKIWVNKGYQILEKYVAASGVDCIGEFEAKNGKKAAEIINKWCAKSTNDMIKQLA